MRVLPAVRGVHAAAFERAGRAQMQLRGAPAAAALAALLLCSPLQQISPLVGGPAPVLARELASGSGSKVNKDPESLLRLGLPNQPKAVRDIQVKLEEVDDQLTRLLLTNAKSALDTAKGTLKGKSNDIVKAAPAGQGPKIEALLASINTDVAQLGEDIGSGKSAQAQASVKSALKYVTQLEEIIAADFKQPKPPAEYTAKIPYLKGRATIDWVLKRDGAKFDVDGKLYDKLELTTIIDGYTAPVTAGNFVDLVQKGFYNGYHVQRSDGFVVQTGDAKAEGKSEKTGYVPAGQDEVRKVPLEVYVQGDKQPIYGATFDDDGRGGYAAALPFNAYGALGMAREEYDADSASSQFFWLLFDSDLTPAGKNLLDGRYACFGYTVDGARLLSDVKEGDIIVSAKVRQKSTRPACRLPQPTPVADIGRVRDYR